MFIQNSVKNFSVVSGRLHKYECGWNHEKRSFETYVKYVVNPYDFFLDCAIFNVSWIHKNGWSIGAFGKFIEFLGKQELSQILKKVGLTISTTQRKLKSLKKWPISVFRIVWPPYFRVWCKLKNAVPPEWFFLQKVGLVLFGLVTKVKSV